MRKLKMIIHHGGSLRVFAVCLTGIYLEIGLLFIIPSNMRIIGSSPAYTLMERGMRHITMTTLICCYYKEKCLTKML